MLRRLTKLSFATFMLLACVFASPNYAEAQFQPFGLVGETWNSPAMWSGCGGCWPSAPAVVVIDRPENNGCCEPAKSTPNSPGCKPACGPCTDRDQSLTMKYPTPRLAIVSIHDRLQLNTLDSPRQSFGTEHVVPARRKPLPPARPAARDVAKLYPENDGWTPVSSKVSRSQDQRLSSTR